MGLLRCELAQFAPSLVQKLKQSSTTSQATPMMKYKSYVNVVLYLSCGLVLDATPLLFSVASVINFYDSRMDLHGNWLTALCDRVQDLSLSFWSTW